MKEHDPIKALIKTMAQELENANAKLREISDCIDKATFITKPDPYKVIMDIRKILDGQTSTEKTT